MPKQLDILALEPFYGGARRVMLENVVRCSRHRWTVLKLPPRRIERRLSTAAHWFGEQVSRHWVGPVDVVFVSEAMNLSDLRRLTPALLRKPAVVYFHANQLPDPAARTRSNHDVVNLNTAAAADEIWFNSLYHLRTFLARASALVRRHPELSNRNPMPMLTAKSHLVLPPIGLPPDDGLDGAAGHGGAGGGAGDGAGNGAGVGPGGGPPPDRGERTILVDTRDADVGLLAGGLRELQQRGEPFDLITIGPLDGLPDAFPRDALPEHDHARHAGAMRRAGLYLSVKPAAPCDHFAVRAMALGCQPIVPRSGVYPELIPEALAHRAFYDGTPDGLAGRVQDAWYNGPPEGHEPGLLDILDAFDPVNACRRIDDRLDHVAAAGPAK